METQEIWKEIFGYEDYYSVSNLGNVKRIKSKKNLVIKYKKNGYAFVCFSKKGKIKYYHVHRLVAQAFIDNPENKPQVNHINGIKSDNNVRNLEWVTSSENAIHSYKHLNRTRIVGLAGKNNPKSKPIVMIDLITGNEIERFYSSMCVQRKYGFNGAKICRVAIKKYGNKTAYGYDWKFL